MEIRNILYRFWVDNYYFNYFYKNIVYYIDYFFHKIWIYFDLDNNIFNKYFNKIKQNKIFDFGIDKIIE